MSMLIVVVTARLPGATRLIGSEWYAEGPMDDVRAAEHRLEGSLLLISRRRRCWAHASGGCGGEVPGYAAIARRPFDDSCGVDVEIRRYDHPHDPAPSVNTNRLNYTAADGAEAMLPAFTSDVDAAILEATTPPGLSSTVVRKVRPDASLCPWDACRCPARRHDVLNAFCQACGTDCVEFED